ncbi:MAG: oligosaccharide flippase family protein [Acidimicrobiales bacterium]
MTPGPRPTRRFHLTSIAALVGMSPEASRRAGVTMADQCVASASNFVVGVAVARIAGAAGLGAYSLAYTCWILMTNTHRSLITDPMAILNDVRREDAASRLREGFAAEVVLGVVASVVFAVVGVFLYFFGQHAFGVAMIAMAPWIAFLDLQDYWRWIGFMNGKPGKSLLNDTVFNCAQACAFIAVFLSGASSVVSVISAWGFGALVGSIFGLRQFSVRPSLRGGLGLLRARWHMSKWLAGNGALGWGGTQLYLVVVAVILGPAALGGLKAAQNLVTGPSSVVVHAGGSFGLPEASRALEDRGWVGLRRVSRLISGAGLLSIGFFGAIVVIWGGTLLRAFYGPSFGKYEPAAQLFAIAFVITAFGLGPILTLKATKRTRPLLYCQVIGLVVSVPTVAISAIVDGVTGAAAGAVFTSAIGLAALLYYQRSARLSLLAQTEATGHVELIDEPLTLPEST